MRIVKEAEERKNEILDVAERLFGTKGFDNTSTNDILNEIGIARGTLYYHFKSKEEIIDALSEKLFFENNPFVIVKKRKDLNGLQKMREVIKINYADAARNKLSKHTLPVLKNPRILAGMIDTDRKLITPLWLELIEEGQRDGSIQTEYAKELSELLPLLTDLWLSPSVYPASVQEIMNKFNCISTILNTMGVALFDDELTKLVECHLKEIAE